MNVLLIAACQDDQVAADGLVNSKFTEVLLSVWDNGNFRGDYPAFFQAILARMPDTQTPNLDRRLAADLSFERQRPFSI